MNKNKILDTLYRDAKVDGIVNNITKNDSLKHDLKAEVFLILCEMDDSIIIKAHKNKYLLYLFINILKKQYMSSTSPFHKKYRGTKHLDVLDVYNIYNFDVEGDDVNNILRLKNNEVLLDRISDFLDTLLFLDSELFKMYYKLDRYNIIDGDLQDIKCKKPTSSYRKIAENLKIGVNKFGRSITITPTFSHQSVTQTLKKLKELLL